ncbi:MAG: hypothetical protein ACK4VO_12175 [Pseudobdellovibrio sp.]
MLNNSENELITIKEASVLLKANIHALRYAVRVSRIPYSRVNGRIYFNKSRIIEWVNRRIEISEDRILLKALRKQQRAIIREIKQLIKK